MNRRIGYIAQLLRQQTHIMYTYICGRLAHAGDGILLNPVVRKLLAFGVVLVLMFALWAGQENAAWGADVDNREDNTVNSRQTADNSFLYDTSIYELNNADASFQNNTVQVTGEVVGDSFRAEEDPGKYWITLEAAEEEYESSIAVLVSESDLALIDSYGAYNRKGTTLQVRGTFYLACPSHEGIMDIHAERVTLVAAGYQEKDVLVLQQFYPGIAAVSIGVLLAVAYRILRERER